jgi:hypothetical protein
MLTLIAAAVVAVAPLSAMLPMTVDVTTPDGAHHLVPVNHTSGRLLQVCAYRTDDKRVDVSVPKLSELTVATTSMPAAACAPIVVHHTKAAAVFDPGDPIDSDGDLHVVLSAPDNFPGGPTSIAVGCGIITGAAISGAVVAEAVRASEGASEEVAANATNVAVGLWVTSGVAAVGTGFAVAYAWFDAAPESE